MSLVIVNLKLKLTDEFIWSELLSSEPWPVADALLEGVLEPVSESPFRLELLSSLQRFFSTRSLPLSLCLKYKTIFLYLCSYIFYFFSMVFYNIFIYLVYLLISFLFPQSEKMI